METALSSSVFQTQRIQELPGNLSSGETVNKNYFEFCLNLELMW